MDTDRLHELIYKGAPVLAGLALLAVVAVQWATLDEVKSGGGWTNDPNSPKRIAAPVTDGMTLLMVETETCSWCKRFHRDVAPGYRDGPYVARAALRTIRLGEHARQGYRLAGAVTSVPTFILLDSQGVEVDRIRGYPGPGQAFYGAMDRLLAKADRGERAAIR